MKKIISGILAAATAISLCFGSIGALADEPMVKKAYSVEQLGAFSATASDGTVGSARAIDTYQKDGRTYVYLSTSNKGLMVYDVTEPNNPQKIQENSSITTSSGNPIKVCGNRLFFMGARFYCLNIGDDGKVDDSNPAASSIGGAVTFMDKADNFVFAHFGGSSAVRIFDVSSEDPFETAAMYTDAVTGQNIRAMKVHKMDNNIYRIAYVLQTSSNTFKLSLIDYNSESKEFNLICEENVSDWNTNGFKSIAFLNDTKIILSYRNSSAADYYYTVDFTGYTDEDDTNNESIISSGKQQTNTVNYPTVMQELYDNEVIAWSKTSYIKDFSKGEAEDIGSTTIINTNGVVSQDKIRDFSVIGNVNEGAMTYLASDNVIIIAKITRRTITEEEYNDNRIIDESRINPSEITTLSVAPRLMTGVAAKVGEKTIIYGLAHNNAGLYAFDVTNHTEAVQKGSMVSANNGGNAEMYVKDGYLIFGNGNNVQVNALNEDGSVGERVYTYATGGEIKSIILKENLLFVGSWNSNKGVTVFDVTNPGEVKELGVIDKDYTRGVAIEKLSNIRYRVYILQKTNNAGEDGQSETLTLKVKDVIYALGSFTAETVTEATIPSYTGEGWPGYNGYASNGGGRIALAAKGTVAVDSADQKSIFIVDMSNPVSPKVVNASVSAGNYRQRKIAIDSEKLVEVGVAGSSNVKISDYTDTSNPRTLAEISGINGNGASMLDNYLYTTKTGEIQIMKVYDEAEVSYGEITFDKTEVVPEDTTASVEVTNTTDEDETVSLIIALYSADGQLKSVNLATKSVKGKEIISAKISADDIPDNTAGMYFKAMIWKDAGTTIQPIKNYTSLGK